MISKTDNLWCFSKLSCMDLSGVLPGQDRFRLGLASHSLLQALNAHYRISALHFCVFLSPSFVMRLLSRPSFPLQKTTFSGRQSVVPLTIGAVGVLQAEAGLVTLSHLGPVVRQQVVVGEHLDAVVVPEDWVRVARL